MCGSLPGARRRLPVWFCTFSAPGLPSRAGDPTRYALCSLYTRGPAGGGLLSRSAATRAFRYCVCGWRQLRLPLVLFDIHHRSARRLDLRAFRLSWAFRSSCPTLGNRVPLGVLVPGGSCFLSGPRSAVFVVVPAEPDALPGGPCRSCAGPLSAAQSRQGSLIVARDPRSTSTIGRIRADAARHGPQRRSREDRAPWRRTGRPPAPATGRAR